MSSSLLQLIRKNLSLELLQYKNDVKIIESLYEDFKMFAFFNLRMNFTLMDYKHHCISKNIQTFKPAIWLTLISWSTIIYTLLLIIFPSNTLLIDLKIYEKMLNTNRCDLIVMEILFTCIILELLWTVYIVETLEYRSSFLTFFTVDLPKFEPKIDEKMRQILIKFQAIVNFIVTGVYLNLIILIACFSVLVPLICLKFYLENQINLNEFLTSTSFTIIIEAEILCITGQLFTSGKLSYFSLIFFKERIKRLHNVSMSIKQNSNYFLDNIHFNQFCYQYIILYNEIYRLNCTAKIILFALETLSKLSIMIACVFYSRQQKMSLINTLFVSILLSVFIFMNFAYAKIACLPSYNEQCTKNLLQWLVHLQWQSKFKRYSQIRQSIKANLFIQSMTNNRLGFTCGPLFYINKYKFFELLMLNIPWILLFYKQICFNNQLFYFWKNLQNN
ncbi:hypothetical protein DERP_001557 [Dermatophagoides pteronyssinus]|uniref:Odorant receptor n=1 Tax=Dermatophagoides pteronyssinus TaxID=6956 RepID=A0ABQ8JBG7_DERPT|nr:hypothetical protein DERP_001557 [Dermatophagoides pteronyssinus]